jgi:hypothetical protein
MNEMTMGFDATVPRSIVTPRACVAWAMILVLGAEYAAAQSGGGKESVTGIERVFCAGVPDDFNCAEEPAAPNAALLLSLYRKYDCIGPTEHVPSGKGPAGDGLRTMWDCPCFRFLQFDQFPGRLDCGATPIPLNAMFAHRFTFSVPPGGVTSAVLKFRARAADKGETETDFIAFGEDSVYRTGSPFTMLPGAGGLWSHNQDAVFSLNLGGLPSGFRASSVLGLLQDGNLDVIIGNETGVDWMCLCFPVNVMVRQGWNLVAAPVAVSQRVMDLYPDAQSPAFAFLRDRGYFPVDSLKAGTGYWLKFPGTREVQVCGAGIDSLSIQVAGGWNLVSPVLDPSLSGISLLADSTTLLSPFYVYRSGYFAVSPDSLMPGEAAWVKTSGPGSIHVLPGGGSHRKEIHKSVVATSLEVDVREFLAGMHELEISDENHCSQTLYFGHMPIPDRISECLELPPPPPSGIFDARFSSSRIVETYSEVLGQPGGFPIEISSARYPVAIRFHASGAASRRVVVSCLVENRETARFTLEEGEPLLIRDPGIRKVLLRIGDDELLPTAYGLHQNYPNPFNPLTTIKYDLPEPATVKLRLYNMLGQEVRTIIDENQPAGFRWVDLDATGLASGVYFYRIITGKIGTSEGSRGGFVSTKKMILLK